MRRLKPQARVKRMNLEVRRIRKRRIRLFRQRFGYVTFKERGRARRPAIDRGLFEKSCDGVAPLPLEPSHFQAPDGKWLRCYRLTAPSDFRYTENPDEVLRFFYELRRQVLVLDRFRGRGRKSSPNIYISMDSIEAIDIEAALIFAAEVDRFRQILRFRPIMDDANWDPEIRAIFYCLGVYRVLEARQQFDGVPIDDRALTDRGLAVVPFVSCHEADPAKAKELRDGLLEHCASTDEARHAVYDSLVEAFLNAVQHAYRPDITADGLPSVKRWWAGALIDKQQGYLYLVVYDQGVGIPATLIKRPWWHLIAGKLLETNDARIIEGALEYGRSGTSKTVDLGPDANGRGNGLWRMCELTEAFEDADVRFTSLKGDVLYSKGGAVERTTLRTRFCGTMVTWRAKIPSTGELTP